MEPKGTKENIHIGTKGNLRNFKKTKSSQGNRGKRKIDEPSEEEEEEDDESDKHIEARDLKILVLNQESLPKVYYLSNVQGVAYDIAGSVDCFKRLLKSTLANKFTTIICLLQQLLCHHNNFYSKFALHTSVRYKRYKNPITIGKFI